MSLQKPREATHKFYVDDSGTKEYSTNGTYSLTGGGVTPFFVFGGMLLTHDDAGSVTTRMRELKRACFGREDVEIKANWLRIPRERQRRYIERFQVTEERLVNFVERVYDLIVTIECKLLAAIVVKAEVQRMYGEKAWYAPALAYECLLQRVQMEMAEGGGIVHVTVDDMDGATPRGSQYRDNLQKHHAQLVTTGSTLQRGFTFDRLAGISFADSRADERLQLADLISYAVYRQFVDNPDAWDADTEKLDTYAYLRRITRKFRRSSAGVISGYGIVKFPTVSRRFWGINEGGPPP